MTDDEKVYSVDEVNHLISEMDKVIAELKTENAALRERLEKLYDKKVIANMLARLFSCPCNFTPLDEEMLDYCNDDCVMEDAVCWERVIDKEMRGKEAEARLAELKGEER